MPAASPWVGAGGKVVLFVAMNELPDEPAGHPKLVAALLMVGVVALLFFLAWVSTQ